MALKSSGVRKGHRTLDLIGLKSLDEFRAYIELRFLPGMNWGNMELDHIIPCASFDLAEEEEQRKCFHYSNIQPLWPEINRKKGVGPNVEALQCVSPTSPDL